LCFPFITLVSFFLAAIYHFFLFLTIILVHL
jgi:hypothetical protein